MTRCTALGCCTALQLSPHYSLICSAPGPSPGSGQTLVNTRVWIVQLAEYNLNQDVGHTRIQELYFKMESWICEFKYLLNFVLKCKYILFQQATKCKCINLCLSFCYHSKIEFECSHHLWWTMQVSASADSPAASYCPLRQGSLCSSVAEQ